MSLFNHFDSHPKLRLDTTTRGILLDEGLAQSDVWSPATKREETLRVMNLKLASVLKSACDSSGIPELIDALNQTTAEETKWGVRRGKRILAIAFFDANREIPIGAASWDYVTGNEEYWYQELD